MQSLNYAAQAEVGLKRCAKNYARAGADADAKNIERAISIIQKAVHFQTPDGGAILADNLKGIRSQNFSLELPFPVITVAHQVSNCVPRLDLPEDMPEINAGKRCVISWKEGGFIHILSSFALDDCGNPKTKGLWVLDDVGVSIRSLGWNAGDVGGRPKISVEPFVVIPSVFKERAGRYGNDAALKMALGDSDFNSVLELIEAMSCSNVSHEPIQTANPAINDRRVRAGKLPLYEIRVLTIVAPERKATAKTSAGGTHASPREHLRRGHIRNMQDGRKIWIQSCVVNAGSKLGKVDKSYSIVCSQ